MINYSFVSNLMEFTQFIRTEKDNTSHTRHLSAHLSAFFLCSQRSLTCSRYVMHHNTSQNQWHLCFQLRTAREVRREARAVGTSRSR